MGSTFSIQLSQGYPPKPQWWQKDIPDLTGKVMIVTGAKTGVGKETVKALLQHNAKVYLAARGKEDCEKVISELKGITGKEAIYLELDLSSFASIRAAAQEFLSKESQLHVLFNNAGVMWCPSDWKTKQGHDLQLGIHVIGPHLFTQLLVPALTAGAKTSSDGKARIVNTASSASYLDTIHWDIINDEKALTKWGTYNLYNQSKFAQVVWTEELARRYADKNIISFAVNPGLLRTGLQRHQGFFLRLFIRATIHPVDPYGPLTQLYGGTSPDVLDKNGAFLIPWARVGPMPSTADDPALGKKFWDYLEKEVERHSA